MTRPLAGLLVAFVAGVFEKLIAGLLRDNSLSAARAEDAAEAAKKQ